ncbi:hypothetical protein LJK89_004750 [Vibrio parahaemolyticus]|nr:hypothetical protein [Vibrio parahaemolyticus]ELB2742094.1 hypothetical protein [Vibrio parahaemolyticus]
MNSDDIGSIIDCVVSKESAINDVKNFFMSNKMEALSFLAGVASLAIALIAALLGNANTSYISLLAFYAFLVLYSLSSFISTIRFFVGATKETLMNINERYKSDYLVAQEISTFGDDSIDCVKILFEDRIRYLESRVGFLVGIVDKLGIVPAVLMIYLAYVKALGSKEMFNLSPLIIGIVSGVYLGAISARIVIDALRDKIAILELSKKISKKRKGFKLP